MARAPWWHTIELGPGELTPGCWDLRPTAARVPWPGSLAGLRCLDVGTMDGFWAFELERRAAGEVVAIDVLDPAGRDAPAGSPPGRRLGSDARFRLAAERLGSRARLVERNVYDLDPARDGRFEVIVAGYVLQMLRDPLRALAAMRSVCAGWLIVVDTVSAPLSLLPAPVARLNARRGQLEWFVFNRAGLRQALGMTGFDVEAMVAVRDTAGPAIGPGLRLRHRLGLLGRSVAVRARAR